MSLAVASSAFKENGSVYGEGINGFFQRALKHTHTHTHSRSTFISHLACPRWMGSFPFRGPTDSLTSTARRGEKKFKHFEVLSFAARALGGETGVEWTT